MGSMVPVALEWWLRDQGKFKNGAVATRGGEITDWNADIPQPTDQELLQIVSDFESHLVERSRGEKLEEDVVLQKLRLSDAELLALKRRLAKVRL